MEHHRRNFCLYLPTGIAIGILQTPLTREWFFRQLFIAKTKGIIVIFKHLLCTMTIHCFQQKCRWSYQWKYSIGKYQHINGQKYSGIQKFMKYDDVAYCYRQNYLIYHQWTYSVDKSIHNCLTYDLIMEPILPSLPFSFFSFCIFSCATPYQPLLLISS